MGFEYAVVMPTYNRAGMIAASLESVLGQSLPPAGVVVVDDGSTDGTEAVVASFRGRVQYHRVENGGPSRARNIGVRLTSTPWIAFCDSDDLWDPRKMEIQSRIHQLRPEVRHSFTDVYFVRGDTWTSHRWGMEFPEEFYAPGREIVEDIYWVYGEPLYARFVSGHPVVPSATVIARDRFDKLGGFNEAFSRLSLEDFEFVLRCAEEPFSAAVMQPLVGFRRHASNYSGNELAGILSEIAILEHAMRHHREGVRLAREIEKIVLARRASAAMLAFRLRDFATVREVMRPCPPEAVDWKLRLKSAIAAWPGVLAKPAAAMLLGVSDFLNPPRRRAAA